MPTMEDKVASSREDLPSIGETVGGAATPDSATTAIQVEESSTQLVRSSSLGLAKDNDLEKKASGLHPREESAPSVPYSLYSKRQKWAIVALVSLASLFSPMSANIYFPAIPSIAEDLGESIERINLTVTVYMVFQATSPTFWAAFCDVLGRRPVFLATLSVYLGACIGLACTHEYWLLMLLRCLSAFGSAPLIAAGAGTVADIAPPSERGGFYSLFGMGAMLGPCIGPVAGGLITHAYWWQAMFAFLAAFGGLSFISLLLFLPETLRSLVANGSVDPPSIINHALVPVIRLDQSLKDKYASSVTVKRKTWRDVDPLAPLRPFRQIDNDMILLFNAVAYTLFYCVTTSVSILFKSQYGLDDGEIGLCFIAFGVGCVVSSIMNGFRLNNDFRVTARKFFAKKGVHFKVEGLTPHEIKARMLEMSDEAEDFPIERARLRTLPYFYFLLVAATITYGWTVQQKVHLAVPLICLFIIGVTSTSVGNASSTLLLDLNPSASASVVAANNLCRCSLGALGTAVIQLILDRMSAGWTFTMLSLISMVFSPLLYIEWRYGRKIKMRRLKRQGSS